MKGCLIMIIIAIGIALISMLFYPPDDKQTPEILDKAPVVRIIDGIEYIEKPIENNNIGEKTTKIEELDYVESGSVDFFTERGPEEFERNRKNLTKYPNVSDFSAYLHNEPVDLMREKYIGQIVVLHGEVDEVNEDGYSLKMRPSFYEDNKYRIAVFCFSNEIFPFAKGCQPGDYILIKGTISRIVGFANLTDLVPSKIHYNFGSIAE